LVWLPCPRKIFFTLIAFSYIFFSIFSGVGVPAGGAKRNPKILAACELLYPDKETSIFGCVLFGTAGGSSGDTCFLQIDATP